ncbi:thioesterase family protein [Aeromicrobium stalagmiti]|uniref:thioesterase family protein n=1 Tax=Aeromicrobium stalagmiti TaxID=2738988 RepID=UPI0015695F16|nr:thioesterase family protein [Aeromicrobium stalagmiti]
MTDETLHELPMRWADLDSLNHVNNVVYLDYAAESRALLVDDGLIGAEERPVRIGVDFLRPILLSRRPVQVRSVRSGSELTQRIRPAGAEQDFARVVTELADRPAQLPARGPGAASPLLLRRSDLDATGSVRTDKMFELFQESRIPAIAAALTSMSPGRFVAAHVEVEYGRPITWRREPFESVNWVTRIGGSSVTIESQIADGDEVVARCRTTLVGFDLEAQRSRRLSDDEKAELATLVPQD